ncbi:MAG: hypothetical protein E2O29_02050 [Deltaproteobacteria bacterium]|nr:MAG: hypothetical protein E2O29_02050 [Deltaproteobacteria bacterium]
MAENSQENPQLQQEWNKVNVQQMHLIPLDADPDDLRDGDMWYRGDTDVLQVRVDGVTKAITVT